MLCVCVTLSKFQNGKKFRHEKKAPNQCDQSRSVTKVRKTENKSRVLFLFNYLPSSMQFNNENLTITRKKASDNSVGKEAK